MVSLLEGCPRFRKCFVSVCRLSKITKETSYMSRYHVEGTHKPTGQEMTHYGHISEFLTMTQLKEANVDKSLVPNYDQLREANDID